MQLNLGCGGVAPNGWVNVDNALGARVYNWPVIGRIARRARLFNLEWPENIVVHDLTKPFPWRDVSAVYSSHTLEHLTKDEGRWFLAECHRVLTTGGLCRIVVPDLRQYIEKYERGETDARDFLAGLGVALSIKRFVAGSPHKCMYDHAALVDAMSAAGFRCAVRKPFDSAIRGIERIEHKDRAVGAVIVEGIKS